MQKGIVHSLAINMQELKSCSLLKQSLQGEYF